MKIETDLRTRAEATVAAAPGNYNQFASQLMGEFTGYVDSLIEAAEDAASAAALHSSAQLKNVLGSLGTRLRDALEAHEQSVRSIQMRTDLLWWRQSGYSPRLERPYRQLPDAGAVAVAAAVDLHQQVPDLAPLAVEHVLADLVSETSGSDSEIKLTELAAAAAEFGELSAPESQATPRTVLDALTTGAETPLVADDAGLGPSRAAVLLFRDLQATRLLAKPPEREE